MGAAAVRELAPGTRLGRRVAVHRRDGDGVRRRARPGAGGVGRARGGAAAGRGAVRGGRGGWWCGSAGSPPPRCSPAGCGSPGRGRRAGRSCRPGCSPTTPAEHDLPGLLAPLVPLDVDDGRGGRLRPAVGPPHRHAVGGPALLPDRPGSRRPRPGRRLDRRLGGAAGRPGLPTRWSRHLAVTVDTAPTGGTTVARPRRRRTSTRTPPRWPGRVLDELAAITPATAAEVDARLTRHPRPAPGPAAPGRPARRGRRRRPLAARHRDRAGRLRGRRARPRLHRLGDRADPGGVRPGHPPRPRPASTSAERRARRRCWSGREAGPVAAVEALGALPARLGVVGVLGAARGAPAGRGRPGAGPAARPRPVPPPGDLAV